MYISVVWFSSSDDTLIAEKGTIAVVKRTSVSVGWFVNTLHRAQGLERLRLTQAIGRYEVLAVFSLCLSLFPIVQSGR